MLVFTNCEPKRKSVDRSQATMMYNMLRQLVISYTDSLSTATDSVSIASITERYEELLTELIFKYPANTDLLMTNGQQDTISNLTAKFVRIKNEKIKGLNIEKTDRVTVDSINKEVIKQENKKNNK